MLLNTTKTHLSQLFNHRSDSEGENEDFCMDMYQDVEDEKVNDEDDKMDEENGEEEDENEEDNNDASEEEDVDEEADRRYWEAKAKEGHGVRRV